VPRVALGERHALCDPIPPYALSLAHVGSVADGSEGLVGCALTLLAAQDYLLGLSTVLQQEQQAPEGLLYLLGYLKRPCGEIIEALSPISSAEI
jgi:hypothetical protein